MPLARFVEFHDVAEEARTAGHMPLAFAVVVARAPDGVVLVFNRYRQVWELPGGLIDVGESARSAAVRELAEEAGVVGADLEWRGVTEVDDGSRHFGAVFVCSVARVLPWVDSEEIGAMTYWRAGTCPEPLGHTDAALLARFGERNACRPGNR